MSTKRPHIVVDAADPITRGEQRGTQVRPMLEQSLEKYFELFAISGRTEAQAQDDAHRTLDTIASWQSRYADEIAGVARGAGVETWQIAALNARTEILSAGGTGLPGECSTIAKRHGHGADARVFSIQTWDWHVELDAFWHTHETHGFGHGVVGMTEAGIIGKAGMNSVGFGTHFNILGHAEDGAGGVPVHVLASAIVEQCASIEEALDMVRGAPISASSAFTMVEPDNAVSVELSPAGVFVVPMRDDRVVRTNHFLTEAPQQKERVELYEPDSSERLELIEARFAETPDPRDAEALLEFLYSGEGEPPLCAVADMEKPYGERWATLATVTFTPSDRTVNISAASPLEVEEAGWVTLTARD